MTKITTIAKNAAALLCIVAAAACTHHKIIPDKTLAAIFHDAFLTNAYIDNRHFRTDSLDMYNPIFEKYGYTNDDVQYTIGNFSKRKNARLGDVVELAIKQLEDEGLLYEHEAVVLDSIDNIARRAFRREVYRDSLIRVSRLKDTDRLHIKIDNIRTGEYQIDFDYLVDSLDETTSRRAVFTFERADSSTFGRQQQSLYRDNRTNHVSRTLQPDTSVRRITINLMEFSQPRNGKLKHFGVKITNLTVVHTPDAQSAVDSLYEKQMPAHIFFKEFFIAGGDEAENGGESAENREDAEDASDAKE